MSHVTEVERRTVVFALSLDVLELRCRLCKIKFTLYIFSERILEKQILNDQK